MSESYTKINCDFHHTNIMPILTTILIIKPIKQIFEDSNPLHIGLFASSDQFSR